MNDGSILRLRKTSKIIRYVRYNNEQDPENDFREQLMPFYPWRKEEIDLREMDRSYETCYQNNVEIILTNKMPFELDNGITNVIEETMDHFPCNPHHVVAAEIQHNEAIDAEEDDNACAEYACFNPDLAAVEYDLGLDLGISRKQVETNDISFNSMGNSEYNALVRSLNEKQKIFFYHVLHKIKTDDLPIYCFLTGGAGVGKSLLTTCLFQAITRFYSKKVAYNCDELFYVHQLERLHTTLEVIQYTPFSAFQLTKT